MNQMDLVVIGLRTMINMVRNLDIFVYIDLVNREDDTNALSDIEKLKIIY